MSRFGHSYPPVMAYSPLPCVMVLRPFEQWSPPHHRQESTLDWAQQEHAYAPPGADHYFLGISSRGSSACQRLFFALSQVLFPQPLSQL